jgi:hypothetical protein
MDRCKMGCNGECNEYIEKYGRTGSSCIKQYSTQFAAHSSTVEAAGLRVAAAFGFMLGQM